jgi:GTP-binding protein Era
MVAVSFDPDAGTLYWYFTELVAGGTAEEAECDATLLLDADGQIIGVELELDDTLTRDDLELALSHPQAAYSRGDATLTVRMVDEEPAEAQPLHEPAVIDFDADGRLQGCEVLAAPTFGLAERLERLAPFMIDLDEDEEWEDEEQGLAEVASSPTPNPQLLSPDFRTGFVALVGKPNVGKSTLLNALLGQKVAIVSPKPQTTRIPMRGILTRPDAQVIFVDTPGIHDPRTKLGSFMVDQARRAIPDADVVCFLVDITVPPARLDRRIAELVRRGRAPRLLVLNKVDQPNPHGQEHLEAYRALGPWDMELAVSALKREGLDTLLDEIVQRLPLGPPHYPDDQLTDQSIREQAAELVREQVLRHIEQEVPHGVAVEIEEWEEKEHAVYIRMTIYVEKESQKGILIGSSGAMLKRIGSGARRGIEELLGRVAYLDLWVKARPNWRDDPSSLRWLGYDSGKR